MKNKGTRKVFAILVVLVMVLSCVTLCVAVDNSMNSTSNRSDMSVLINAFDQNPQGKDTGKEWVMLYNPANSSVNISGWTLSSTHGTTVTVKINNVTLPSNGYWTYIYDSQWLDNDDESIILKDEKGEEIDRTPIKSDKDNDNRFWKMNPDGYWIYTLQDLEKGKIRRGKVVYVEDGDTIDISPVGKAGLQRLRLVCIDAPEIDTEEGKKAKEFVEKYCLGKEVEFDVDDLRQYDKYNRILAVVHVNDTNLNAEMLEEGLASPFLILPSEFVPKVAFVYYPKDPFAGQNITFDASSSYTLDPDALIASYKWYFGDGEEGSEKIINHSYSSTGNYTVTLVVTDSDGEKRRANTVNTTIQIREKAEAKPVHNFNTGKNFSTIQAAIEDPSTENGHTIIVDAGTYHENVNVTKRLILMGVDTGSGKPVVDAGGNGSAVTLSADGITLKGFNATNSRIGAGAGAGIKVNSSYNNITGNIASNNHYGIYLSSSRGNNITGNTASNNIGDGILLYFSCNNNTITGNKGCNNSIHGSIFPYCGIHLYSSSNNTITGNSLSNNNDRGIRLWSSSNNTITGNNVSNNRDGITLWYICTHNIITGNNVSNNDEGISLFHSSSNKIYLNNFMNNTDNVYSYNSTNFWNSTEKITYTYNGSTYTNYMGNYWSDYEEKYPDAEEIDGWGIGDTPYSIDSDADNYPLMVLWENYFAQINIFDTGSQAEPYPSISGTHNGTITLNQTITVSKLYTYPCVGTGGHTEYVRLWNSTLNVTATWKGYQSDWHNITFNESFTLLKGEAYSYTIRTGSYPQIIHSQTFTNEYGTINCTEFIDKNRNIYNDRIPAIKLN